MLQTCRAAAIHSSVLSRINVDSEKSDGDPLPRSRMAGPRSVAAGGAGGGDSASSLSNATWGRTLENVPGRTKSLAGFLLSHGQ